MSGWLEKIGWKKVDFGALIDAQLTLTTTTLDALEQWCREPSQELMDTIFALEEQADQARAALAKATQTAFETPFDREDLSDLSRCIDDVVDSAKSMVRLGMALKVKPHKNVADMVANLHEGGKQLHAAVMALPVDLNEAFSSARAARRPLRLNERLYATGVAEVCDGDDFRNSFRQMELFHAVIRLSEFQEAVADLFDHALNKLA